MEVCPNPYGDDGAEFIKAKCSGLECMLDDGESSVYFTGSTTLAKNPDLFQKEFGYKPNASFPSKFALSNSGEKIYLYEDGIITDFFDYSEKGFNFRDDGLIYFRDSNNGRWDFRYQDWSNFSPVKTNVTGRIIVSPTSYELDVGKEVFLASYTYTGYRLLKTVNGPTKVNETIEGENLGPKKELFLDATPVGGIPFEELRASEDFNVHFLESNSYKNFHYKFGIIDNKRVVITTENWKWDKRGYIVEFESEDVADYLKEVLINDIQFKGESGAVKDIEGYKRPEKEGKVFYFGEYNKIKPKTGIENNKVETSNKSGSEENENDKKNENENKGTYVEVFVLPDYNPVFDIISSSEDRLLIQVPYMDFQWFGKETPLLDSIINSAENGAKVRILLDCQYNQDKNHLTVDFLNEIAENEGLNIEARIMDFPLHGKMVVSDNTSLVTSANFNRFGLKLNRECGIIFYDTEVSSFLAEQFNEDWGAADMEFRESYTSSSSAKPTAFGKESNLPYIFASIILLSVSLIIIYFALGKKKG